MDPVHQKVMSVRYVSLSWKLRTRGSNVKYVKGGFTLHVLTLLNMSTGYEVLASHKIDTLHWYCATCTVKSVQLLRLVFGLQDRLQKFESDLGSITSAQQ